jgi:phosphate transport system ATP-binding protein
MRELKKKYTIGLVTHNLQQAKRVADKIAFLFVDTSEGTRTGYLVEYADAHEMFEHPRQERTQEYIAGEFS